MKPAPRALWSPAWSSNCGSSSAMPRPKSSRSGIGCSIPTSPLTPSPPACATARSSSTSTAMSGFRSWSATANARSSPACRPVSAANSSGDCRCGSARNLILLSWKIVLLVVVRRFVPAVPAVPIPKPPAVLAATGGPRAAMLFVVQVREVREAGEARRPDRSGLRASLGHPVRAANSGRNVRPAIPVRGRPLPRRRRRIPARPPRHLAMRGPDGLSVPDRRGLHNGPMIAPRNAVVNGRFVRRRVRTVPPVGGRPRLRIVPPRWVLLRARRTPRVCRGLTARDHRGLRNGRMGAPRTVVASGDFVRQRGRTGPQAQGRRCREIVRRSRALLRARRTPRVRRDLTELVHRVLRSDPMGAHRKVVARVVASGPLVRPRGLRAPPDRPVRGERLVRRPKGLAPMIHGARRRGRSA